ncbi:MAG TPA: tetratricopeptide repeat protein [Thermoanaerobaculia bacterium]|jgi:tetratricopeptide (TPR) repeat protein|nr:tetratricopeptide repeat protein [Thermoanaerobaculia bacterium]
MLRTSIVLALLFAAVSTFADDARPKAVHNATVLVDEGKVDEAIAALKKLAADDPADIDTAYELGLAYAAKGDNANCRKVLEPLAEIKSDSRGRILGMLGNCLDQMGESEKAIAAYRRGLQDAPDDSGLLFNLAVTLFQRGEGDEARDLLKQDVEKNPAHASGHLVLAQVFEAQGFYVPATFSYLHFLALEPASKRSAIAATHLSQLLGRGFEKTKKGANITIDPAARKEEGDYTSMQMMMAIARGGSVLDDKKSSDFEKLQDQLSVFITMFVESSDKAHGDFTSRVQAPLFEAMTKAKVADTFAGIALASLKLAGTEQWAKSHEKEITAYFDWIRPQLQRPGVILPKS